MNLEQQHDHWNYLTNNWHTAPKWRNVTCQQHQTDLDRYAQVITELKPAWIMQTGIYWGGTSAFMADVLSKANPNGRCLFVDITLAPCQIRAEDLPNTTILQMPATSPEFFEFFTEWAGFEQGLISLDDLHTREQVAVELDMFADFASYLVVEDTILDIAYGTHYQPSNPKQALDDWLPNHPEFTADPDPEPTQHVGGWLRRTS